MDKIKYRGHHENSKYTLQNYSTCRHYGLAHCLRGRWWGDVGGGGTGENITSVSAVTPVYSAATNWNDYVRAADTATSCDGSEGPGYETCIHGGEALTFTGPTTCSGLTAVDDQGAFNWACNANSGTVVFTSTGLADGKFLSDLIDFTFPAWKAMSVTASASAGSLSNACDR